MNWTKLLSAAAACAVATAAAAEVQTKEIEYTQGGTVLQGFLAWDDAAKGRRPGVLVIHEWWGLNEHARAQAQRLAKAGYVGFALDMYGKGKVATHPNDAKAFMQEATKDPEVASARFDAAPRGAEAATPGRPGEDRGVRLLLRRRRRRHHGARRQGPRRGGHLPRFAAPAPGPMARGKVKPAILVQTGGADPMVPRERVQAFEKEMKDAGARVRSSRTRARSTPSRTRPRTASGWRASRTTRRRIAGPGKPR